MTIIHEAAVEIQSALDFGQHDVAEDLFLGYFNMEPEFIEDFIREVNSN